MADEVRIVRVDELKAGMAVLTPSHRREIWKVEINLGWRLFHQPHLGKTPYWNHYVLFRRLDVPGGDEVSFIWAFKRSDVTVDVLG